MRYTCRISIICFRINENNISRSYLYTPKILQGDLKISLYMIRFVPQIKFIVSTSYKYVLYVMGVNTRISSKHR